MHQKDTRRIPVLNQERIAEALQELSKIGRNPAGGIDRQFGSEADRAARSWMTDYWKKRLHLTAKIDAASNLWILRDGLEPLLPIYIGSHLDTVPNGGMYDGAMGVLLATELLQTIQENEIFTRHPVGVVAFTGEEPNPFHISTFGSKAIAGRLTEKYLGQVESRRELASALEKTGGSLEKIPEAQIFPGRIAAFLECHIEQGRRLYDRSLSIAAVERIAGIYRELVTVEGEANHAGTTMPRDRKDALLAASELNLMLEKTIAEINREDVVATIGKLKCFPNAASIIPGTVTMTLDVRACSRRQKEDVVRKFRSASAAIAEKRRVKIRHEVNLDQSSCEMNSIVRNALDRGVKKIGEPVTELVSMAGHDSVNMSRIAKTGMLFVQSIDGKSHCPEERTSLDDIMKAGKAMLEALMILDREMD